ncbi:GNAT family N-acetyltransferase [Winogradskyella bathintestinalis]|uniref:GNAT family N-acetyltransferase n=1 Tax=Winogradskyella bathintestinalis TaxID=3035208 RepID=A0ABT7ZWG4_9FLAO|nr:GNAT family N-acetyltransferase [Winogradskyella bathintestinalis]MDN3493271.1 GNAT family N-acetyltransferase [Winogradskyella bathintestinalis]
MELKHEETTTRNRFYLVDKDMEVGEITYAYMKDHIIDINHTEIHEKYRGQDLGEKLVEATVNFARKKEVKITASCPYAKKVLDKADKYNDVIA